MLAALLVCSGYKEVPPPAKVVLPPVLSPAQSLAAITVAAGLEVELVAAEPMVMDPVDIAWGADGRMWVIELIGYMENMAATTEWNPTSRVSVLEDTNRDGSDVERVLRPPLARRP